MQICCQVTRLVDIRLFHLKLPHTNRLDQARPTWMIPNYLNRKQGNQQSAPLKRLAAHLSRAPAALLCVRAALIGRSLGPQKCGHFHVGFEPDVTPDRRCGWRGTGPQQPGRGVSSWPFGRPSPNLEVALQKIILGRKIKMLGRTCRSNSLGPRNLMGRLPSRPPSAGVGCLTYPPPVT
jgi:hypothetical protein